MRGIVICGSLLVVFLVALALAFSQDQAGAQAAAAPPPGAPAQTVTLSGHVRDQAGPVAGASATASAGVRFLRLRILRPSHATGS